MAEVQQPSKRSPDLMVIQAFGPASGFTSSLQAVSLVLVVACKVPSARADLFICRLSASSHILGNSVRRSVVSIAGNILSEIMAPGSAGNRAAAYTVQIAALQCTQQELV